MQRNYKYQHCGPLKKDTSSTNVHDIAKANAIVSHIYAIQNQILSMMFLGTSVGHCPSSASRAALPVVISALAGSCK